MERCPWALKSEPETVYHDTEWGMPVHDDRLLFEFLVLEGAQAGLSWATVLNKRDRYREVFDAFDLQKVARYTQRKVEHLLADPGIIRNRLKVESVVTNARAFLAVQDAHGSFDAFLWDFVDGQPVQNAWRNTREVPATTPLSVVLSKALKQRGFRFVGPTICYAFMQATGLVNDHLVGCYRHAELQPRGDMRRG